MHQQFRTFTDDTVLYRRIFVTFHVLHENPNPIYRVISFAGAQTLMVGAIAATFSTMECSRMFTIEVYLAYVLVSTGIMLFLPGSYYKILIKRHNARPISEIVDWAD